MSTEKRGQEEGGIGPRKGMACYGRGWREYHERGGKERGKEKGRETTNGYFTGGPFHF
jgi:hypothetical protein